MTQLGLLIVKVVVVIFSQLLLVAFTIYFERKLVARIQQRVGPIKTWPRGLGQPIADIIKLLFKEDIIPAGADRFLFTVAPLLSGLPAFLTFAVVPFGKGPRGAITNLDVGVLYFLALSSLGVYGIVIGGWASNNKYSLLGALRSSAQLISYELGLGLSVIAVVMLSGSLDLMQIVVRQQPGILMWNVCQPVGFIAFIIFLICSFAELNRAPFDLPEAETELVAGYHTEYSSMKFALYFLAEYCSMITLSAISTTLFFGGWSGVGMRPLYGEASVWGWLAPFLRFFVKVFLHLFFMIWVRGTLPRLRYDQLMNLGWKVLIPAGLANIGLAAVLEGVTRGWF